jgi:hypothetical protein
MSELSEEGCPDGVSGFMDDAIDCDELDEVGCWRQGPVRSRVVNIQKVKGMQLEGLLVLPCYDIEMEEGHEGTTTVMGLVDDEAENKAGEQREGICDACLGSVIIGETCVCSVELFDGSRDREQCMGGVAARESREKVDCLYDIMTENEGDYLYLEAGTPVSKEGSDGSGAAEAWNRLPDRTQANGWPRNRPQMGGWPPTSTLEMDDRPPDRTQADGRPPTATQMDGWPRASVPEADGRLQASVPDGTRTQTDKQLQALAPDRPQMGGRPPTSTHMTDRQPQTSASDRPQLGGWPPTSM